VIEMCSRARIALEDTLASAIQGLALSRARISPGTSRNSKVPIAGDPGGVEHSLCPPALAASAIDVCVNPPDCNGYK